jgi:hypothetical protein
LLRDLERSLASGDLKDSELGPLVLRTLQQETELEVVKLYDPRWITVGIRVADSYFRLIRPTAGQRNWQGDLAKTAAPILAGIARSLSQSVDAQGVIARMCEALALRL